MRLFLAIMIAAFHTINLCYAQISPGDLSRAHENLEGMMKCTQCHVLGGNVSNAKCLDCHKELQTYINQKRGYHSSNEVKGKECASCHSEHHGRNFDAIHFSEDNFNHNLTRFELTGEHKRIDCRECHKPDLIADRDLKGRNGTFLGMGEDCISCHDDVHQGTLDKKCTNCHTTEAFAPAEFFDHDEADFRLIGRHKTVECRDCHKVEQRQGKEFQRFTGLKFNRCNDCHVDVHDGKFGNNCTECHSEESFHAPRILSNFDHNITGFELIGRHKYVDCRQCHKSNYTDPIPHNYCASCHKDYHRGQLTDAWARPDCNDCHTVNTFEGSLYTIERHNQSEFPLEEAHLATPCFSCHKKQEHWSFKNIGNDCVDCHTDVHLGFIDSKYYSNQSCESCHQVTAWQENHFDHELTGFRLEGAHARQLCMDCHTPDEGTYTNVYEGFLYTNPDCTNCHEDVHQNQFAVNGSTDCTSCHGFETWGQVQFDHNTTEFPLDGKHVDVDCHQCHKPDDEDIVQYKFESFQCIDCHL